MNPNSDRFLTQIIEIHFEIQSITVTIDVRSSSKRLMSTKCIDSRSHTFIHDFRGIQFTNTHRNEIELFAFHTEHRIVMKLLECTLENFTKQRRIKLKLHVIFSFALQWNRNPLDLCLMLVLSAITLVDDQGS